MLSTKRTKNATVEQKWEKQCVTLFTVEVQLIS